MCSSKGELPLILKEGLDLYLEDCADVAVSQWAKGSAQDGSVDLDGKSRDLRQIEDAYGQFFDYKVKEVQVIVLVF